MNYTYTVKFFFFLYFQYVQNNKEADNDWFRLESNKEGTRWFGKCWYIHELLKYEFDVEFDVSF
jgi:ufm1-conjugating enzyme 1